MPPVRDGDDGDAWSRAAPRAPPTRTTSAIRPAAQAVAPRGPVRAVEQAGLLSRLSQSFRGHASTTTAGQPWCQSAAAVTSCSRCGRGCGHDDGGRPGRGHLGQSVLAGVGHDDVGSRTGRGTGPRSRSPSERSSTVHSQSGVSRRAALKLAAVHRLTAGARQDGDTARSGTPGPRAATGGNRETAPTRTHPVEHRRWDAAQHPGGRRRPAAHKGVGQVEAEQVRGVPPLARARPSRRRGSPWRRTRSAISTETSTTTTDGSTWREPGCYLAIRRPQPSVAERDPVQAAAGGRVDDAARVVVAFELDPRAGPVRRRRQRGQAGHRFARAAATARARCRWPWPTWWT